MLMRSKILLGKGENTAAVSVAVLGKCAAANADIFSLYAASSVVVGALTATGSRADTACRSFRLKMCNGTGNGISVAPCTDFLAQEYRFICGRGSIGIAAGNSAFSSRINIVELLAEISAVSNGRKQFIVITL